MVEKNEIILRCAISTKKINLVLHFDWAMTISWASKITKLSPFQVLIFDNSISYAYIIISTEVNNTRSYIVNKKLMVLFSFELTNISIETISARTFKILMKFQHDFTFRKILDNIYETGLNFTLDNYLTDTTIMTWTSSACITTRHFTTFSMIFCYSILLTALTTLQLSRTNVFQIDFKNVFNIIFKKSWVCAYTTIITRYIIRTAKQQVAIWSISILWTVACYCFVTIYKIDKTSPIILTWVKFTKIIFTAFTNKLLCACTTKLSSSFIVEACSPVLSVWSIKK